ncbi:autotransporter outer membrane beta-barrel domain-containing protein [Pseudorhodoplanes sp.]|uniref:autotransporter family protein n=1 Tax=Pseudorhodoplanes sp. TaxID=1934341 RepID=UPI002BDE93C8|nr:autotransporter outer membrane beta-barrel domain-containing protein [Pseudorhodoplanes sp.]HWV52373.1 autotransporter outer membrane beta-barrel domain-containing protein [Pseudorhodoplanes sp.]
MGTAGGGGGGGGAGHIFGGAGGAGSGGAAGGAGSANINQPGEEGADGANLGDGGGGGGGGRHVLDVGGSLGSLGSGSFTAPAGGAGGTGIGSGSGGGGGAGGSHIYQAFSGTNGPVNFQAGVRTAGAGGAGGSSTGSGFGGSGGTGGTAYYLPFGVTGGFNIQANGTVIGGAGGAGGTGGGGTGAGGAGGHGALINDSVVNLATGTTLRGGAGGTGGVVGLGGFGIVGSNLTINNNGAIEGGLAGDGTSRTHAIALTGGTNFVGGTGTITGGIAVTGGGSFAPALANSTIGSALSIDGPLTFAPGTQYVVRLSTTTNDSVTASGAATLTGASVTAQFDPGSYLARQYTILTASGGLGGTPFTGVTGAPTNFAATLDYQGNDVLLLLSAQLGGTTGGLTVNQQNVADALNGFFNKGGTLPPGFLTLFGLTGDALRNALNQVSGEPGASVSNTTFTAWNSFFNMIFDPFAENRGGFGGGASAFAPEAQSDTVRLAYAAVTSKRDLKDAPVTKAPALGEPFAARWSVWGGGYGASATTEGNTQIGSHDTTSRAYGFAVGADHRLTPDTLIGFALAGGGTSFGLGQGLGGGTSDMFQASVYARQNWGAAYLMGAFGYGWQDFTLKRIVTIAGTDNLEADFNAHTLAGRAEGGWRFGSALTGMTPYAAVQVASLDLPSYSERATSGASTFALSYAGRTDTQTRSELGARFDYAMPMRDALLTLRGRAAWAHDYDTDRIANAGFMALPGTAFTVNGARPDADSLLVSAGAELALLNGVSIAGSFEGEFSGNTQSYAGKGVLRYRW